MRLLWFILCVMDGLFPCVACDKAFESANLLFNLCEPADAAHAGRRINPLL
jgi:hypothetical protein